MEQVNAKTNARRPIERVRRGVAIKRERALASGGTMCLGAGSVVGFEGDAIVNAANEKCQGG